ncbi:hypothetical protein LVD15_17005 [Fulvivirga maritima]|uniref:hypothetical protein n=1 Tax=Fulvivirga maritima TaxID=2904247 RepID=UPI001F407DF5|nr:hypothetical protein [Fulvivirga maritima]UII24999.1 hypothetical protein LVD15_17005 [Fulvivirga maritima]
MNGKSGKRTVPVSGLNSLSENDKLDFLVCIDNTLERIRYREISINEGFIELHQKLNSLN